MKVGCRATHLGAQTLCIRRPAREVCGSFFLSVKYMHTHTHTHAQHPKPPLNAGMRRHTTEQSSYVDRAAAWGGRGPVLMAVPNLRRGGGRCKAIAASHLPPPRAAAWAVRGLCPPSFSAASPHGEQGAGQRVTPTCKASPVG